MEFVSFPGEAASWWRGRRVVITGASGFIGRHLVQALSENGSEVHALVRKPSVSSRKPVAKIFQHRWDLAEGETSLRLLTKIKPDVVFHGAVHRSETSGSVEPSGSEGLNKAFSLTTEGGKGFAHACGRAGVKRFVLLGSSSEYGPRKEALHEGLENRPLSIHARAKAALTAAVKGLALTAGLDAVILRIFYAYGSGDDPRRFIPTVCRAALTGKSVRLTPRGYVRDYVHVDDVITACLRAGALTLTPGEVINVGTGVETDNHEIVSIVRSICGGQPPIDALDFTPRPADAGSWRADTSRMRERLGILATTPIEDGLRELLESERKMVGQVGNG